MGLTKFVFVCFVCLVLLCAVWQRLLVFYHYLFFVTCIPCCSFVSCLFYLMLALFFVSLSLFIFCFNQACFGFVCYDMVYVLCFVFYVDFVLLLVSHCLSMFILFFFLVMFGVLMCGTFTTGYDVYIFGWVIFAIWY